MWESIDLRELRVFLTLADELHFGRTAERLGLTQSAVSQSLRALEQKLGQELFHRTSRRVSLTEAGKGFYDEVAPAYSELAGVLQRTRASNDQLEGTIRIGVVNASAGAPHLLRIVSAFEARNPQCEVQLVELPFRDRFAPLRAGKVEAMVARLPLSQPDLTIGPILTHETRMLAVAVDHPLAGRDRLSIEDVADYKVAWADLVPKELEEAYIPPRTPSGRPISRQKIEVNEFSELLLEIARGKTITFTVSSVADHYAHPDLVYIPIVDLPVSSAALVWRRRARNPRLRELIRCARSELGRAGGAP